MSIVSQKVSSVDLKAKILRNLGLIDLEYIDIADYKLKAKLLDNHYQNLKGPDKNSIGPLVTNYLTKVFLNGVWIGLVENPIEFVDKCRLLRRYGIIPLSVSIAFMYLKNEIYIFSDQGRLLYPVLIVESNELLFKKKYKASSPKAIWQEFLIGTGEKVGIDPKYFYIHDKTVHDIPSGFWKSVEEKYDGGVIEYMIPRIQYMPYCLQY